MGKGGIKKLVLNYLVDNEIFPEEDLECRCHSVWRTEFIIQEVRVSRKR